jgi:hypothetical protein
MNGYCCDNAIEWAVPATFKPRYTQYLQAQKCLSQTGTSCSASVASQACSSLAWASWIFIGSPNIGNFTDFPSVNVPMKHSCSPSFPPPHLAFKHRLDSNDSEVELVYPPRPVKPKSSSSQLKKASGDGSPSTPIVLSSDSEEDSPVKR